MEPVVDFTQRRIGSKAMTDLERSVIFVLICLGRVSSDRLMKAIRAGGTSRATADAVRMCANRLHGRGVVKKTRMNRRYALELADQVQVVPHPMVLRSVLLAAVVEQAKRAGQNERGEQDERGTFALFKSRANRPNKPNPGEFAGCGTFPWFGRGEVG